MKYAYHEPVLLREVITYLITDQDGIYVDGTLGGGGHALEVLNHISDKGKLFGIDQDDEALEAAGNFLGKDQRYIPVKGNFGYMDVLLPPDIKGKVSGILLDLGVSSHQLESRERGFGYQQDSPLDMRMGTMSSVDARQVVNDYSREELAGILFKYGEERFSRKIADAIIRARPVTTTKQLRDIVESIVKGPHATKSVARVFQAIRIEVNRELDMLETGLAAGLHLLKKGGRFVVISYHSLEDRMVKNFFKTGHTDGTLEKDFYGNPVTDIHLITRNVITASESERDQNPRSRSAKMRVAEKTNGD